MPSGTKLLQVAAMREGRRQEVRIIEMIADMVDFMVVVAGYWLVSVVLDWFDLAN